MQDVRNDVEKLLKESEVEVFKKGETSLGIKGVKVGLGLGNLLGIFSKSVAKDGGFGDGVAVDVKEAQKKAGLTQKNEIDDATVTAIWTQVEKALKTKLTELDTAKKDLATTKKQLDAANKKIKELEAAKAAQKATVQGDADGDGKVTTKDLLFIRKLLAKKK